MPRNAFGSPSSARAGCGRPTDDLDPAEVVGRLEPGRQHEDIDLVLDAVGVDDAVGVTDSTARGTSSTFGSLSAR
jgi:hypothetical protein